MIKKYKKLVFFDIGGTLIGSPQLFEYIAKKYKYPNKDEIIELIEVKFQELYGNKKEEKFLNVKEIIKRTLKYVSLKTGVEDLSSFAESYYEDFYLNNSYIYDDVISTLNTLKKRGVKIVVLSDSDSDVMYKELRKFKIYDYFDGFVISGDVKSYKPSNKIINEAKKYIDDGMEDVYMVGNADVDILSADKIGAKSVYVKRNNKCIDYKPCYEVSEISELLNII
ncbi:MAG: HAD family hydrolase [Clostridium sp.]|nr:HAD family hydrolase [Clostridium sp.]